VESNIGILVKLSVKSQSIHGWNNSLINAQQKVAILKRHLVEGVPISDLCDESGAPSRSNDPKPLVSGVTENGSGSKGLNIVQCRARTWGTEQMNVQEQIKKYIANQPEPKRSDMLELHQLTRQMSPEGKLWFFDGKDSKNHTVSNPTIGYGFHTIKYANGKSREFFKIGVSGNKTGISVYILGLKDKKYLAKTYGKKLGKASVTGYCIRFKALKDINIDALEAAIRYGLAARNEKGKPMRLT
jgi:hypothetical protein